MRGKIGKAYLPRLVLDLNHSSDSAIAILDNSQGGTQKARYLLLAHARLDITKS